MAKEQKAPKFKGKIVVPGRSNQWRMAFYEPEGGKPSLSLRKWFMPEDKDDFIPTKQGLNISPELTAQFYLDLGEMIKSKKAFRVALKKAKAAAAE